MRIYKIQSSLDLIRSNTQRQQWFHNLCQNKDLKNNDQIQCVCVYSAMLRNFMKIKL